ncbi:HPP family protein [Acidocella sp.]|uniref:HPP family protein n=1 Tax=Acidocella sp. TaxID=50710 RepID=UPI00260D273D|nr:HPP family protein [Acidocella sp.]
MQQEAPKKLRSSRKSTDDPTRASSQLARDLCRLNAVSSKAEKHTTQSNPLALDGRRARHPFVAYAKSQLPLSLASGLGGGLTILLLAQLSKSICTVLLIAPFGASYVLLFAIPQSPLAQPKNVIGGIFFQP